ncbi:MAG TPA: tetratricopeptide repeat protein [Kofleriaceae bacterium]|jgi:tetratricopeptide (TPR) repeat protein
MAPEDETGAREGAPDDAVPTALSDRAKSLAARIDAMSIEEDEEAPHAIPAIPAIPSPPSRPIARPDSEPSQVSSDSIDVEVLDEISDVHEVPQRPSAPPRPPAAPPPRPVVVVPPLPPRMPPISARPPIPRPAPPTPGSGGVSAVQVPPLPSPAAASPPRGVPVVAVPAIDEAPDRARRPSTPPSLPPPALPPEARARRASAPPPLDEELEADALDGSESSPSLRNAGAATLADGGIEVGVETPNVVIDQPLEAHLESPTVLDRALDELGDAGGEKRAETVARDLDATSDSSAGAVLAYELGELYERRLADEARAVKAYGRALALDPSYRANLWAIRRVFYRRGLWPNLTKLITAELAYARDDYERADLLVEKARVSGHHMSDAAEARAALDEAVAIAPQHQGALLELERAAAKAGDTPALLDVWERLAEAVELPARKIAYWLDVGRTAGGGEYARAQAAFDQAQVLADMTPAAERVARERLRVAEEHGSPDDVAAAIETLSGILIATLGPAGADGAPGEDRPARATQLLRELVALRRRQAQLARGDAPEKAWDVLQQALAMAPGEPLVLSDLTELAEELGRYADLAEIVQSWQAVEGDPGRAMVLSIRRADALLRGGQRDQARALLASLEASAPGFVVLTSAAERDALARGDAGDLAKTYLSAAHAALLGTWLGPGQSPQPDPRAAAALYVQAADLLAYDVAPNSGGGGRDITLEEARTALGKALEAVPDDAAALEALVELDDAMGNANGLMRLRTQAGNATGDAKRAFLERAIRLARSHGELESVLDLEKELVAIAPDDLALRWRLEATLAQLGRDDERAAVLGELAPLESDATRRGTALLAAARLRERGGAVEAATELYRQVLAIWPEDTFARESLVDLLRAQEKWTELVTERRAEARALPDGGAARRALREAAWVLEVRLGDTASAAAVYDEWLLRIPDDRTALEGAARCRAAFGDRNGEVVARKAIADGDPSPEAQWLLGRALERAGQFDEAAEVFRALATRAEPSVASTAAALALADLAAGRADTVMRVEATAALAGRTGDPRLGAALAEDSGWMYALVLEDFERASQSFAAATALEGARGGALLGAALVSARRQDPAGVSAAYDALAGSVKMPEAAAALHLRAAATAAAAGDLELANQRVAAARAAAPDDASALVAVAESTAPSPGDAELNPLLARAEILEMRAALADDPASRAVWELDRAEALELAGRLREAGTVVAAVLAAQPGDLRALDALRRMSQRAGDKGVWARGSYALAKQIGDLPAKLGLLRDAASVFDAQGMVGSDPAAALSTYRRILQADPGAPEHARFLELLRAQADVKGLVAALSDRLAWLDSGANQEPAVAARSDAGAVPLLLERATVLHGLGDRGAATDDLDALLDRAPNHTEALRFRADLAFHAGEVDHAVALWRRYIAAETRGPRRAEIELQLSQVLAENVNDLGGAIENLAHVVAASPDDVGLHERLLALSLRAGDWDTAGKEYVALVRLRPAPADKAREELRLALLLRDKKSDRTGARVALERARAVDPLNLDVIRELTELLDPTPRAQVLAATAAGLRASIVATPKNAVLYDRLAQVTGWERDVDARWLALVGFEALGTPTSDQKQVLQQGRGSLGAPKRVKLDDATRASLRGELGGPLVELWRAIAPAVQGITGVDPAKLGFARGDRIALKKLGDKYEPLAAVLAGFGVEDVEIYLSASRAGMARALADDTPILCVGADVAAASTPAQRFALARAVATLAEGLAGLDDLRDGELGWTVAAALRASESPIPQALSDAVATESVAIAERAKQLKLSRKARGAVAAIAQKKDPALSDTDPFRARALAVGHRAGLAWCGDLAVAHALLDVGKGGRALIDAPSALELTAWSVGEAHAKLRETLGVAIRRGNP